MSSGPGATGGYLVSYFHAEACRWRVTGPGLHGLVVFIDERQQRNGLIFYAVVKDGWVATKNREWEREPIPSSRDEEFLMRARFDGWEEAALVAQYMAATPSLWTDGRRVTAQERAGGSDGRA